MEPQQELLARLLLVPLAPLTPLTSMLAVLHAGPCTGGSGRRTTQRGHTHDWLASRQKSTGNTCKGRQPLLCEWKQTLEESHLLILLHPSFLAAVLHIFLPLSLLACLPPSLPVCLPTCLPACLPACAHECLTAYLPARPPPCR